MQPLPEELLSTIFSYLQPKLPEDISACGSQENHRMSKTLAAVCRASKQFQRLATPLLYHTIQLYGTTDSYEHPPSVSGNRPNIKPLLRTILQNRELAKLVKAVKVEAYECECTYNQFQGPERIHRQPDPSIQQHCAAALEEIRLTEGIAEEVVDGINRGLEEAELALLMGLLSPSIETFHSIAVIPFDSAALTSVPWVMSDMADVAEERNLAPPFPKLKEIAFRNENAPDNGQPFDIGFLGPYLILPSIEKVYGFNMTLCGDEWDYPVCPSDSITRVRTHTTEIEENVVEQVLRKLKGLKEFEVVLEEDLYHPDELPDHGAVGKILRQCGGKLEKLVWDARLSYRDFCRADLKIGDLSPLSNLRELAISVRSFLGDPEDALVWEYAMQSRLVDLLPPSLEILSILDRYPPPQNSVQDREAPTCAFESMDRWIRRCLPELVAHPKFMSLRRIELDNLTWLGELEEAEFEGWRITKSEHMVLHRDLGFAESNIPGLRDETYEMGLIRETRLILERTER